MNVEINGPKILGYLFGNTNLPITETMRNSWIIMAFILFLCIFLTHRMQKIPKGKQALAEKAVLMIDGLVESTMGEGCQAFSPYIMTLMMSSLFGSLASLFWMRSTTADLNTTLGWAIITFVLITFNKIKYGGIKAQRDRNAGLHVVPSLRQHGRRPGYHHTDHGRTQGAV